MKETYPHINKKIRFPEIQHQQEVVSALTPNSAAGDAAGAFV